jgi:hypothetical protein
VITDQPPTQIAFGFFPIIDTEFLASVQPPLRNTVKANQLAAVEQGARGRVPVKDTAPTARHDAKQSEATFQMFQAALKAS